MDLGHHIYRLVVGGKMNLAPLSDKPQRVLDIGTGTGIWAIDFAEYASYLITDRMMADLTQRESFR